MVKLSLEKESGKRRERKRTFTVRIIVEFLYQDGHLRYKPTFSVFVLHVTVLVQKLNNNSHNK
jgi:hypothetical protein